MSSITPSKKSEDPSRHAPAVPLYPAPAKDSEGRKITPIEEHSLEDLITIIARIFIGIFFTFVPFKVDSGTKRLHRAVNFALRSNLKGLSDYEREKETALHKAIQGQYGSLTNLQEGYLEAQELQKKLKVAPPDPEGLARIVKHREILKDMGETIATSLNPNASVAEIFKRIDELEKKDSDLVVHHADGSSSFSIPGGTSDHYVLYEFKRDAKGDHYFIIHNRDGVDETIHGPLKYEMNNKIYAKTSVAIKVDKAQIQDKAFVRKILDSMDQDDIETPYQAIKDHLLAKGAAIRISAQESEVRHIKERMDTIEKETRAKVEPGNLQRALEANDQWKSLRADYERRFVQLIDADPSFHSKQVYTSCAESCLTGPEKSMASKPMRRQIKLNSIVMLTSKLEKSVLKDKFSTYDKEHAHFVLYTLLPKRKAQLEEKIKADSKSADPNK